MFVIYFALTVIIDLPPLKIHKTNINVTIPKFYCSLFNYHWTSFSFLKNISTKLSFFDRTYVTANF